jgi:1A family penicillin-binding protein
MSSGKKVIGVLVILFALMAAFVATLSLPRIPRDLNQIALSNPTMIYGDDGRLLKILANREVVPLEKVVPVFLRATVALEDAQFYQHHGFSKRGFFRAVWFNLTHFTLKQGGSTITQQLAKNLFFGFDRSWLRKIKEVLVAFQIEQQFSKEKILEAYVNQIDFGSGVYGIELAGQTYFAKHAAELSLAEASLLAGIPRWPARYNPFNNEKVAKERQAFVLHRMVENGSITPQQMQEALQAVLVFSRINPLQGNADYFVQQVKDHARQNFGTEAVNYGGLRIYTTLNSLYQYEASRAVAEGLARVDDLLGLPPYHEAKWNDKNSYPQAALVALDPLNGTVKAMVGGRDFRRAPLNRAVSMKRHAGSSFKPFVYLAALEQPDITPLSVYVDEEINIQIGRQNWSPDNFDRRFRGPLILKEALAQSINVITVKLIEQITPAAAVSTAHRLGIESELEENLSLALGAVGVSPLEMAGAYATIANQGTRYKTYYIKEIHSSANELLEETIPKSQRVVDSQTCFLLTDMMRAVLQHGTAASVRRMGFNRPAAGKTGTSSDYRDAWFIGFTPELVTAVWVGFDDNRSMRTPKNVGLTGDRAAAPIWTLFMQRVPTTEPYAEFPVPEGIRFEIVDPRTGAEPMPGEPSIEVAVKEK